MSRSDVLTSVRHLRGLLAAQRSQDDSDEQLLHAFADRRDDLAFTTLVRRHGPMVLGVCRRVLGHEQDAEDVFQATFVVLARRAAALRDKSALASFLYGTAYHLASKSKRAASRRRKHEDRAPARPCDDPSAELLWREVRTVLDEEIARLPESCRSVFVLCVLENLSQAEAGRRLGLKERTVSNRLAEARRRLQQRLAKRGVELTAVLAASALAVQPASALPLALLAQTTHAARAMLGEGGLAALSPSVAALVENSSPILGLGKAKLTTLILLAGSLLGGGGAVVHFQTAAAESEEPPAAEKAKSQRPAVPAAKQDQQSKAFAGRVLDPDGKPIAGAKLYLLYYTPKKLPIPVRAASDKDGRFRFTAAKKEFDQSASARPWDEALVVAMADGYGVGVPTFQDKPTHLTLRLAKDDVPITGRILDLQGKPVAGVTVSIHGLFWTAKADLTDWLLDLKKTKEGYPSLHRHLIALEGLQGRDLGLGKVFPPTLTGADGRICLRGVGRERVAALHLRGPGIAVTQRFAMTRPAGTIRATRWRRAQPFLDFGDEMIFCGADFEYVAAPCQPIVGVIRDKDTGKPLPGAVVRSYALAGPEVRTNEQMCLHAVADRDGRYRLTGMPKGEGNVIRAEGPVGQPYLMSLARVPKGFALEPITIDFQLKRGVWIEGTVTDKATGKPVHSQIHYAVSEGNPFLKEAPGLTFDNLWTRDGDGSFRFVGLPGRGVVTVLAKTKFAMRIQPNYDWAGYFTEIAMPVMLMGRNDTGVDTDPIKGLDRLLLLQSHNTVAVVNPAKDAKAVRCDIVLDPGRTLNGKVHGPDGRPLTGVWVASWSDAGDWKYEALRTADFTVAALRPGETRLLLFLHAAKHLAGSLVLYNHAEGPLTVKLGPAGTLTGRFVTRDAKKPLADLEIFADSYGPLVSPQMLPKRDPTFSTFPRGLRTDKEGKFRIENLVPGLKYRLVLSKGMFALIPDGPAGTGVTVQAGETKDLGEVTVKMIE